MILITGASAGIGEATARLFAQGKHPLLLIARRKERLEALASELAEAHGVEIRFFPLDVRDAAKLAVWSRENASLLDRVTVLVNNAGLARGMGPLQEGRLSDWDEMIDTNIKSLLTMSHLLLPHFLKNRAGHIVNLGSVAGHHTYPGGNVYCATKFAVHALSESLRLDLNGSGIRVTEISPGLVETEFSQVRLRDPERAKAVYEGLTPLDPRDVAEAIYWSISRPAHVNIQEIILYPTDQASPTVMTRRKPS